MKTRYTHILMLPLLAACTCGCSDSLLDDDDNLYPEDEGKFIREVVIRMPELKNADTRTLFDYNEETGETTTKWLWTDVIGVVPVDKSASKTNQVKFPLSEGDWTNEAKFDGGAWSLKTNVRYAAYFPFSADNYEKEPSELTLSYEGQVQDYYYKWNTEYLGKYDFMAARAGMADENGSIIFEMQRLGGVVGFHFPAGLFPDGLYEPARLVLSAEEPIFGVEQELDLTGDVPVMTPKVNKKSISMNLQAFYLYGEGADDSYAYMMLPPMDGHTVTLSIFDTQGTEYFATISNFKVNQGAFNAYEITSMQNKFELAIEFEDENAKNACLEAFDGILDPGNPDAKDGILTYGEAAAVTEFAFMQGSNYVRNIRKFNEFQYFTGVTELPAETFVGLSNFHYITLPESLTSIGAGAFAGSGLTSIEIPENVTFIGERAFFNCRSLNDVTLPSGLTTISNSMFTGCKWLQGITLPDGLITIEDSAFQGTQLNEITIPASVTSIGDYAFSYCQDDNYNTSLKKVTFLGVNPPSFGEDVFDGTSPLPTFYVPYNLWVEFGAYADAFRNYGGDDYYNRLDSFIDFDDEEVERLCLEYLDIDVPGEEFRIKDGRFSIREAGMVTSEEFIIDNDQNIALFNFNESIYSFNEFRFFTGLDWSSTCMWFAFMNCANLYGISIPDNCTTITSQMFDGCEHLTGIYLPASVSLIDSNAFNDCDDFTQVYVSYLGDYAPSLAGDVFLRSDGTIHPDLRIIIPVDMRAAYLEAVNDPDSAWSHYKNYIYDEADNPLDS